MSPLVLDAPVSQALSVTIEPNVDGAVAQELVGGGEGIWLARQADGGFNLAVPPIAENYATSPDTEGSPRISSKPENPEGGGKVYVGASSASAFSNYLSDFQETAEAIRTCANRVKGYLTYTPAAGPTVTYELLSFRITEMPQDGLLQQRFFAEITFEFTCAPYGLLEQVTVFSNANGSDPLLVADVPSITSSAPARPTLTLTEQASVNIDHLEIGLSDPRWDASAWDFLLDKAELTAAGFAATATTRTGAWSAGAAVWRSTLLTSSVVNVGTGSQPHIGRHRIKARVYGAGTGTIRMRLRWRVGSGQFSTNKWITLPGLANWYELDLGLIDIPEVVTGTQSWEGQIEAYSSVTGDTLDVDYVKVIPAWRYFKARAPLPLGTPSAFSAASAFSTESGAITGDSLMAGGTWQGAGDADDFTASAGVATRTATSDAANTGRFATASGATLTDAGVRIDFKWSGVSHNLRAGVLLRYTDASNYLLARLDEWASGGPSIYIFKRVAGSLTTLGSWLTGGQLFAPDTWFTLEMVCTSDGVFSVAFGRQGAHVAVAHGQDAALATGGALASGKTGFYDEQVDSTASTRTYDNFVAWVPDTRHALNAGKTVKIRHDSAELEPASGSNWSPAPGVEGAYPLLAPAGREGLTQRMVISHHPLDTDELPATDPTNAIRADLVATPRVLLTGRS